MKKRLDVLLVERGLAESRTQAQALVLAGRVEGYDKPGTQVEETADLAVRAPPPYVSRGGHKLAHALDALGVDPAGRDCLDVGASTGGFYGRSSATGRSTSLPRSTSDTGSCTNGFAGICGSPSSSARTYAIWNGCLSSPI